MITFKDYIIQQLNEFGGGGFNPSGRPEDIGTETPDDSDDYDHVQHLIDTAVEETGYPNVNDDEGWDELFNSIYELSDIDTGRRHDDILSELLDTARNDQKNFDKWSRDLT